MTTEKNELAGANMAITLPHPIPPLLQDSVARLEQEPLDANAARVLREDLPGQRTPPLESLAQVCAILEGGSTWPAESPGSVEGPLGDEEHEDLIRHPQEKNQTHHRWASFFGRALHLMEGNAAARVIEQASEQASSRKYPTLCRLTAHCAGLLGMEIPLVYIGRGSDRAFAVLVNSRPYLYVHRSWLGEPRQEESDGEDAPLSDPELLFALGRHLELIKGGHVALIQLSPEEMEGLVLDQLPLVVTVPLKVTSKAVGWTGINRAIKSVSGWFSQGSRTQTALNAMGAALPDRDQETILPETALDWVRSWVQALDYTADRAGLLLCGNFASACTTILRLCPAHAKQLPEIQQRGLRSFLQQKEGLNQAVAARLRELLRFTFSPGYLSFVARRG
jgi:hypothetical protein